MSSLNPKFSISVYQPGLKFNQEPYEVSKTQARAFAIHTLIPTEDDRFTLPKQRTPPPVRPFNYSRPMEDFKPYTPRQPEQLDNMSLAQSQEVQLPGSATQSRVKGKLAKDVELAEKYAVEEGETKSQQEEAKAQGKHSVTASYSAPKGNLNIVSPQYKTTTNFFSSPNRTMNRSKLGTAPDFIKMRSKSSALKHTLYYDQRIKSIPKTAVKNPVIDDMLRFEDNIIGNSALMDSIVKLRDMNLLKLNSPSTNRYKGVGKVDYVMNDFHARSTNPGYSRNHGGVFYFR